MDFGLKSLPEVPLIIKGVPQNFTIKGSSALNFRSRPKLYRVEFQNLFDFGILKISIGLKFRAPQPSKLDHARLKWYVKIFYVENSGFAKLHCQ